MKLIDGEKLWDELIAQGVMSKEDAMRIISKQPTIDAIPVEYIRKYKESLAGVKNKSIIMDMLRGWEERK